MDLLRGRFDKQMKGKGRPIGRHCSRWHMACYRNPAFSKFQDERSMLAGASSPRFTARCFSDFVNLPAQPID